MCLFYAYVYKAWIFFLCGFAQKWSTKALNDWIQCKRTKVNQDHRMIEINVKELNSNKTTYITSNLTLKETKLSKKKNNHLHIPISSKLCDLFQYGRSQGRESSFEGRKRECRVWVITKKGSPGEQICSRFGFGELMLVLDFSMQKTFRLLRTEMVVFLVNSNSKSSNRNGIEELTMRKDKRT